LKIKRIGIMLLTVIVAVLAAIAAPARWYWGKCMLDDQFKVVPTRAAMAVNSQQVRDATLTITQSASGTFAVAVQLLGENGDALTTDAMVGYYLSTDATGDTMAVTSTDVTSLGAGTDGTIMEDNVSGNVWGRMKSETDGDIDVDIVVPADKTVYLNLIMPDGHIVHSAIMTYGM
jgi:hypothetical protein